MVRADKSPAPRELNGVHLKMLVEDGNLRLGWFVYVGSVTKLLRVPWTFTVLFHRFERRD
jgi:hypothetical protein